CSDLPPSFSFTAPPTPHSYTLSLHDALPIFLGGAATIWGPVLGSILFWVALVTVRNLAGWLIPESMMTATEREPFSLVLVGVTLMCLVVFRPQGLLGNRRELVING